MTRPSRVEGRFPGGLPRVAPMLACLALLAGCGARYGTSVAGGTVGEPPDVFTCVQDEVKEMGYTAFSLDTRELRLVARKEREGVQRSEPGFLKAIDQLEADVRTEGDGATLQVTGRTFHEFFTRRGSTLVERQSSEEVGADASALLGACATAAAGEAPEGS